MSKLLTHPIAVVLITVVCTGAMNIATNRVAKNDEQTKQAFETIQMVSTTVQGNQKQLAKLASTDDEFRRFISQASQAITEGKTERSAIVRDLDGLKADVKKNLTDIAKLQVRYDQAQK